jgi:hypothetical protein
LSERLRHLPPFASSIDQSILVKNKGIGYNIFMPKSRIILIVGVLIALLPILGFPRVWESIFQVAAGLSIVLLSVWANIDKRLTLKAKAQRRQFHRRKEDEIVKKVVSIIQEEKNLDDLV